MSKSSGQRFVQLHVHSDYSLLDGAAGIEKMARLVSEDNQPGLALTDHGTPAGIIQLFTYAEKYGITPIPGAEVYHVPSVQKMKERISGEPRQRYHMILLAVNTKGYQNLLRLTSEAHTDHFYVKPNLDDEMLAKYSEGLVATSGCMGSRVNQMLLEGNYAEARRQAVIHQDIYGREGYFIELQSHDFEEAIRLMPLQLKLAKDIGAPLLATSDSHYLHKDDAHMHDALLCLGTTALITDTDRYRFSSQDNYIHTTAEMYDMFPPKDFPGACTNTLLIEEMARGIDIGLPKKVNGETVYRYLIPDFDTPNGESAQEHLSDLAHAGVMKRYGEDGVIPEAPQNQLSYELDVIHQMGFDEYFLIVMDIVVWAKSQGILVGPGRGSAAGSLVAYALGITGVDPIKYKLYFERFLNPGRKSMPDIDIDFEQGRRGEVQAYVAGAYPGRVSYIATYGVLKPKSAMNGASRVLGNMVSFGQRLSGMWPGVVNQVEAPISEIIAEKPSDDKFTDHWRMGAGLRKTYNNDNKVRETVDLAISFEGTHNIKGVHPSGMLITPGPLADYVPVHLGKDKDSSIPICSYDATDTEKIGGLKMDILGLVNLSVIGRTLKLIKVDVGNDINIDNIPLDDKKVYKMLGAGESDGVFQLESSGMRDLLRRVKPESIEDISAVIALFRPGPMGSNLHFLFADVKNGHKQAVVPHKDMLTIFKETFGMMVYQEQLILLARHYAGYDATEADNFRKATGKKDSAAVAREEAPFKAGVIRSGYTEEVADNLWEMIPPFAAYAFNKAHSVSYGFISYQTAWLKVNYPAQYAAACIDYLSSDRVFVQVESARRSGVRVSPPNINSSHAQATTASNHVWLGIGGIANCGPAALQSILSARSDGQGNFRDLGDFLVRTSGVNKKTASSLISAGCFDTLHESRKAMHENLEVMIARARKVKVAGQAEDVLDGLFGELMADSGIKGAMDDFDLAGPDYGISQRIAYEIGALGFPASEHPFHYISEYLKYADPNSSLIPRLASPVGQDELVEGQPVTLYGTASAVTFQEGKGSTKPRSQFFLETDTGGRIKCTSFGYDNAELRDGDLVVAQGSLRTFVVAETEQREFRLTDSKVTSLDKVVLETKRMEDVGVRVRPPQQNQDSSLRLQGAAPMEQRTSRRRSEVSIRFIVSDQSQVDQLIGRLDKLEEGEVKVVIQFADTVGSSDDRYDLSEKLATKIAEKLGLKVSF